MERILASWSGVNFVEGVGDLAGAGSSFFSSAGAATGVGAGSAGFYHVEYSTVSSDLNLNNANGYDNRHLVIRRGA